MLLLFLFLCLQLSSDLFIKGLGVGFDNLGESRNLLLGGELDAGQALRLLALGLFSGKHGGLEIFGQCVLSGNSRL